MAMKKEDRIYVASGNSFIGEAVINELRREGYVNIVGGPGEEPDLLDRACVDSFFARVKPEYVFLTAGKSAGIMGNTKFPAELMLDNLLIECHVIDSAYRHGVKKLLYLASSCSYPKYCAQPMKETDLLTGSMEPAHEAYAVAKIAGIKLCQAYGQQHGVNFICGIPADNFGPGDDFSFENSHVIGALIHKMHDAKEKGRGKVVIWGTGEPIRDFIYVEDLAKACIFVLKNYNDSLPINLGAENGISIRQLAEKIKKICGFTGKIEFDISMPDGIPEKVLDSEKLRDLGWLSEWDFEKALSKTYAWFIEHAQVR